MSISGFVIADRNGILQGSGTTAHLALLDAKDNLDLFLWPATQALLENPGPWEVVDGVAMTKDESDKIPKAPSKGPQKDEIFRRFCELQRALIGQIEDDGLREELEAALWRVEKEGGESGG